MQSIDSLRELNAKLLVEVAEFRKENAELRKENTVIPDLRNKLSEFDAERAEFKRKIAEALRTTEEERTRHDVENAKLKAIIEELKSENIEFRDRLTKVEQNQLQDDSVPKGNNTPNNNSSNFNSGVDHHEKSSQEKEMDNFLDETRKKSVGEDIRRRNRNFSVN
ncbi:hypothetical protein RclHR1_21070002 [Rhizophagus clarus]|uniref:Uncharacterized protein n=1 Tax=Rhizophagus clarus TaxID=94130 RepID=A0A2Z6QUA4_9GLOM|nr:hypothetical protein RclHR1_21070002 [Rhizophagus clarus]